MNDGLLRRGWDWAAVAGICDPLRVPTWLCSEAVVKGPAMPARSTAPIGAPCWIDLMSSDTARTEQFYGELFGWTAEEPDEAFGGYFNFRKDGTRVSGCMRNDPASGMPDLWSTYLAVSDAAKTAEAATTHGGQVLVEAMEVGDYGSMAVLTDPGGATIGAWQPASHAGFGVLDEAGTPGWFELQTRDYDRVIEFYRTVFGWDTHVVSDTADFRYTVLVSGEAWLAGVMDATGFLPDGVPAHWSVYFGVDDADATLERVKALGGSVVTAAEDSPYGRLATATDATGAQFKLVAPNEAMPAKDA